MTDRYLEPHQARLRAPTRYEDLLGDAIERAFQSGIADLAALVAHLNASGLATPSGDAWTAERYCSEMAELGR
ncbi:MAG: recombinase-like helix-turn-helix domain-containing protein [Lautropia sp.]